MVNLATLTLLALTAGVAARDFHLVFENTGAIDGLSIYWNGVKEGDGVQIPDKHANSQEADGIFEDFLEVADEAGHMAKFGSRFVVRGRNSKSGEGFRAAVQIQKGEHQDGHTFPYTFIVTNLMADKHIEMVHRGASATRGGDALAYNWIDPVESFHQLTDGTDLNAFELRDESYTPLLKMTVYDPKKDIESYL
jgi:hypothetical protein